MVAPHFLDNSITHALGISMTITSMRMDLLRFVAKETLRSLMRPSTSTSLELKQHTFLYDRVLLRPNYFITFKGVIFMEASKSNIQWCKKRSFIAKVSINGSHPGFRSGIWMFCISSGNSSSWILRDFLICFFYSGTFAIYFKGKGMVILPMETPMSMSTLASFPFSFFLMFSFLGGPFF